jgi:hypothetical protein
LLRENRSLFSTTTTLAPSSWASIAVRKPHGPPPMISTYTRKKKMTSVVVRVTHPPESWWKTWASRQQHLDVNKAAAAAVQSPLIRLAWLRKIAQAIDSGKGYKLHNCNSMCVCVCVCKNRKSRAGVTPFESSEKPPNCWRHSGESRQKNQSGTERGCLAKQRK